MYTSDLTVGRHDHTIERTAPRSATVISFPQHEHVSIDSPKTWARDTKPNFFDLRLSWQYTPFRDKPIDPAVFDAINVRQQYTPDIEEFFAVDSIIEQCLPPSIWATDEPNSQERRETHSPGSNRPAKGLDGTASTQKLANGRQWPTRGDYWDRIVQLGYENVTGFRAYSRISKDGAAPPRLTYARTVFEHLDTLAQFWDTSEDQYFLPTTPKDLGTKATIILGDDDSENEPRKRTKLSPIEQSPSQDKLNASTPGHNEVKVSGAVPPTKPDTPRMRLSPKYSSEPPAGTYRGWRIDTGSRMPNTVRDLLLKALVEVAMWPFGLHVDGMEASDRSPPRLAIGTLRINVPLTRRVWQPSKDRAEARQMVVIGPALGISCRATTGFADRKFAGDIDVLRELGALFVLAQERRRQTGEETISGAGKWWYEKPRWGGLPYQVPGEYNFANMSPSGNGAKDGSSTTKSRSSSVQQEKASRTKRKDFPADMTLRQKAIESYKSFTAAASSWDSKARYTAIGKSANSDYDDVFLVSALNHHAALVRLRVHDAYLEFLETETLPDDSVPDDWNCPIVYRTRWYDLLIPGDRTRLFHGLWGISTYLNRQVADT